MYRTNIARRPGSNTEGFPSLDIDRRGWRWRVRRRAHRLGVVVSGLHDQAGWVNDCVAVFGRMLEVVARWEDCLNAVDCGCDLTAEGAGQSVAGVVGREEGEVP
jgi:hypothetical protein